MELHDRSQKECEVILARALRRTNQKFVSRFQHIEHRLRETGKDFGESNLEEMERFWQEAKKEA